MNFDAAMALVKRRRPTANPIPVFITQLKAYDKLCQKDREEEKTSSNTNKSTTISKRKQRPQGPSLPPDLETVSKKRCKLIGPSASSVIGPSMPSSDVKEKVSTSNKDNSIGPSLPPTIATTEQSNTTIGPTLPPGTTITSRTTSSQSDNDTTKNTIGPSIGPALPPK